MRELNINGEKWVPLEEAESRIVVSKGITKLVYRESIGRNFEFSVRLSKLEFTEPPDTTLLAECVNRDFSKPLVFEKIIAEFRVIE